MPEEFCVLWQEISAFHGLGPERKEFFTGKDGRTEKNIQRLNGKE